MYFNDNNNFDPEIQSLINCSNTGSSSSNSMSNNNNNLNRAEFGTFSSNEKSKRRSSVEVTDDSPPQDNYGWVYIIFFLQGMATLLGWNVFITASEFFQYKLLGSRFEQNFRQYISVVYMLCNLLFRSVAILTQNNKSLYKRTSIALTVGILIFIGMLTISQLQEVRGDLFFGLTLALLVCESLLGAVINSDGSKYIQACISGQGLAGLGVSIAQFVFAISAQENSSSQDKEQALMLQSKLYFSASLVFMIIATGAFLALKYQPLYKYYHKKVLELDQVMETSSEEVNSPMEILPRRTNKLQTSWQLIAKFWPYMFTVCYSFIISLSLFPSVTAAIPSMSQDQTFLTKYFISIHFLLFNIGDYLGKTIPIIPQLYISHYVPLTLIGLLRTLFIPYFLFNNIFLGPNTPGVLKNVFGNDTAFLILVFVFGLTNGYLGSAPMMSAPSQVGLESKSTLSSLMALFLAIGLALGSLVSFGWLAAICNCNPF
ncbi:hypothetical protein CONCODRAFT_80030 [Conidiobolus coronatus NRRL 28638]|uniref:Nucleoside transporter n=1 Tax=Conidiobolus coronatus (strain ATCC 28846 / CBS 209.66 / NRRL 28638) TaxID=796925 RepID=A0A137NYF3_CONC2|nr:hypothetical protein CONCODRAFT_80030 [Conidiobolus coronatus NRRL 28638]|eukprot:KXN67701.1 hypothetical protein CONCODRAFT_80030 [Conidiobolus coronatus NRRL 28638]